MDKPAISPPSDTEREKATKFELSSLQSLKSKDSRENSYMKNFPETGSGVNHKIP